MKGYLTAFLILAFLVVGATYLKSFSRFETYYSEANDFSFQYPRTFSLKIYDDGSISVGKESGEAFFSMVDINILSSGSNSTFDSAGDFLVETMRNMCAADGMSITIYCEDVRSLEPFVNAKGYTGEVFTMRRMTENIETGEKSEDSFGPNFVFNVSEDESGQFKVLVVHPPASLMEEEVDTILLRTVADSIRLN